MPDPRDAGRLARRIRVALGREPGDLLLTGGLVVNVFTRTTEEADVVIADGVVAGVGRYPWEASRGKFGVNSVCSTGNSGSIQSCSARGLAWQGAGLAIELSDDVGAGDLGLMPRIEPNAVMDAPIASNIDRHATPGDVGAVVTSTRVFDRP